MYLFSDTYIVYPLLSTYMLVYNILNINKTVIVSVISCYIVREGNY